MKKLFKSKFIRDNSAGTTKTVSVAEDYQGDESDSTTMLSKDNTHLGPSGTFDTENSDEYSVMTPRTANKVKRRRTLLKKRPSMAQKVSESRMRASARLEPLPFSPRDAERLHELKEAKLRAEERREWKSGRNVAGGSPRGDSSVVSVGSTNTWGTMNTWGTRGTVATTGTQGTSIIRTIPEVDDELMVRQNAMLFLASFTLHLALLPIRKWTIVPLLLVALQAVCLRGLLNSLLVYSFDNVDFGQRELVKNMDYAKRMFIGEVNRYSLYASAAVAAVSFAVALGRASMYSAARGLCSLWESTVICGYADVEVEAWSIQAFNTSSFIAARLGVFVVAALLLGHLMLPIPKKKMNENKTLEGKDRRASAVSRGGKKKASSALSCSVSFLLATLATTAASSPPSSQTNSQNAVRSILVAGSMNADTFLPIHRFPSPGENLTLLPNCQPLVDVPGGKGCNQAIACARLSKSEGNIESGRMKVSFLGQFGNDAAATILKDALVNSGVDVSSCGRSEYLSGRGYVLIVPETGEVSAVVSGGSNLYGWNHWGATDDAAKVVTLTDHDVRATVRPHSLLLLQCEVPSTVNLRLARSARELGVPVIMDVGGEDRPMERDLLECCDYLVPNETELARLAASCRDKGRYAPSPEDGVGRGVLEEVRAAVGPSFFLPAVMKSVRTLQRNGASNVLVTLGSRGSLLVKKRSAAASGSAPILYQPPCPLPSGSSVVDETGAGDCYRAGFAVALLEHCGGSIGDVDDATLRSCMRFAAAAGALAVTKKGAVPSVPSREEVEDLLREADATGVRSAAAVDAIPRGGETDDDFPFLFGSRLNSMKDRLDLVDPPSSMATPRDYVRRQATVRGLDCVDFNYPQHFGDCWTPREAKEALDEAGLVAGAVCLRYPSKFARGAMNHPDADLRREAIEITKQAAEAARILGCNEVVVWSAYDGYDYPFQVSYHEKWDQIVQAFRECCDAYPDIKWSLEYKPTDENTRFFTVPSTGAAILLVNEIDRPNMGLTLDVGHMLMSGENPGQSIAMTGDKLFGVQLNDGYTRLAAEDGMIFGSVHPSMALEVVYQLHRINFKGHMYFDTFPQRTDPVKEAEYNIRRVKEFWMAMMRMDKSEVERIAREHDAIGALELVDEALRK